MVYSIGVERTGVFCKAVKEEGKKMNEKNNSKGREFLLSAKQQGTRPLLIGTHSKVAHRWHHWAS